MSLVSACANQAKIPEFNLAITRPANQDGMSVNVVTGEYKLIPKPDWDKRKRKAVILERQDWEIVKSTLYGYCINQECGQSLDLISGFFEKLDDAVGKIPGAK